MTKNNVQVLIPTYNKTLDEVKTLCHFWNLQSDALISVQTDFEDVAKFNYFEFEITVIFNKTRGVSVNRNILLKNVRSDIGVFIDDDCSMVDGYVSTIVNFFKKHNCDCVCFNGFLPLKENVLIHDTKSKKVTKFHDVSSVGAPGFAFSNEFIAKSNVWFDESLGTPNFIVLGEDSKFVFDAFNNSSNFYRSKEPIFKIESDLNNSSYFKSFADPRFLISKGFVTKLIFSVTWKLHNIVYSYKLAKRTPLSFRQVLFYFNVGSEYLINIRKKLLKFAYNSSCYYIKLHECIDLCQYRKLVEDFYFKNNIDEICSYLNEKNLKYTFKQRKF